jgi:hypothetical protein
MKKDDAEPQKRGRGQPRKGFDRRVPVDLNDQIVSDIDAALASGEKRADLIRAAIAREIERRSKV